MTCEKITEQIIPFLYGELGSEEMSMVETHLAQCSGCNAHFRELAKTRALFSQLPEHEPSIMVSNKILVHAREFAEKAGEKKSWWALFWSPAMGAMVGFFAVALVGLFMMRQEAARRPRLHALKPPPIVAGHPPRPHFEDRKERVQPNLKERTVARRLPRPEESSPFDGAHATVQGSQVELVALGQGRPSLAGPTSQSMFNLNLDDPVRQAFLKAKSLQEKNHVREAYQVYVQLLQQHPNYEHRDQIYYAAAECLEVMGRYDEALNYLEMIAIEFPQKSAEVAVLKERLQQKATP